MFRNILAAVAAAALLSAVLAAYQAAAMPPGAAAALDAAAADTGLIHKVTSVCGTNGCAVVQTRRVQHHQFPKTAVPAHPGS
jgi:hypothetical protein